jgi:hypothetical protein
MAQDTGSLDPDGIDRDSVDESDDTMFTDSFAPHEDRLSSAEAADDAQPEDELAEVEELLPQGEPVDGPAPLP